MKCVEISLVTFITRHGYDNCIDKIWNQFNNVNKNDISNVLYNIQNIIHS